MLRLKRCPAQAKRFTLLVILFSCLFLLTLSHGQASTIATSFRFPIDEGQFWYQGGGYNTHVERSDPEPTCFETKWKENNHAGKDFFTNPLALVPVKAVANGVVKKLHQTGGYPGDAILLEHTLPDGTTLYSMYGHVKHGSYTLNLGQTVSIGDFLGFVHIDGSNTHLHFEVRQYEVPPEQPNCVPIGAGYTAPKVHPDSVGYLNPTEFIDNFNYYTRLQDRAFVFTGSFFRGDVFGYLTPGFRSLAGLFINNAASSLSLPSGWGATVYDGEAGGGAQKFFGLSDWNFSNDGYVFNNQSISVDNTISAIRISANNCSSLGVAAATTSATLSCDPNPAPQPGEPTPAPTTQPNPSTFVGISFFRDKNYGGLIRKLGTGEHEFPDDFLSVRMDTGNFHFTVLDDGGGHDCFDTTRFGGATQYPSFNDHGDWWSRTTRIKIEYGSCPQGPAPTKWVVFFREKNFVNRFTEKPIGYEDTFTDDFQSVKLDPGVSFLAVNEHNQTRCFDLWDFGGSQESSSFNDHGDWWQNTKWIRIQGHLCPPHDVQLNYPQQGSELPFNTDITLDLNIPANTTSVYGEIWGLAEAWQWHQPASNRYWHLGVFPPGGPYTVRLRPVNDSGFGNWTDFRFSVKRPPDCNDVTATGITLFDAALCSGEQINLNVPGWYTLEQFNKRTSSLHVQEGWSIEVMDGSSTSDGQATCISDTKWDLSYDRYWPSNEPIDGKISTVRVFNAPTCGRTQVVSGCNDVILDGVGLYDYISCLGSEKVFTTPGFYNLTDFAKLASSIFVQPGWSVKVWNDHTRYGSYVCFTETKWDLAYDNFWFTQGKANNQVVSIEVFHDPLCGWPQTPTLYDPEYEITDSQEFDLRWSNLYAGDYEVLLYGPNGFTLNSGPVIETSWHLYSLQSGEYTWKVRGRMLGVVGKWSEEHHFSVLKSSETPPVVDCNSLHFVGVQLYTETSCLGAASPVFGIGVHELDPSLNGNTTDFADRTNSLYVGPGMSVKVYQDNERGGLVSCYGETMWNLNLDKYWGTEVYVGNTISSIEVFADTRCGVPLDPTATAPATPTPQSQPTATTQTPTPVPTLPPAPPVKLAVPGILSPVNAAVSVSDTVTLRWSNHPQTTVFAVQVRGPVNITATTVMSTSFTLPPLRAGTYEWLVRAIATESGATHSNWNKASFVVLPAVVASPVSPTPQTPEPPDGSVTPAPSTPVPPATTTPSPGTPGPSSTQQIFLPLVSR